jgi:plastocyanin
MKDYHKEGFYNMQVTTHTGIWSRQPLATLGKLTAAALLGSALAFATLLLTILLATGTVILPVLIVAAVLLVVAGIVATGLRWAPLLGALVGLGTMIGGVFTQQYFVYHLTHPAEVGPFLLSLLICAFAVVAVGAGIGATVQNYRDKARYAPRWLPTPLAALGGFVLGALLVAFLVRATPAASSTTSVNGVPAVHMGISNFAQSSVTIPKGTKLMLVDDGSYPHILSNGMWENNTPHPATEAGAPAVQNVQVNGNSVELGPFSTAGTFHIYCTIHAGMNLTVIVQ